jgi:hypothetical protein
MILMLEAGSQVFSSDSIFKIASLVRCSRFSRPLFDFRSVKQDYLSRRAIDERFRRLVTDHAVRVDFAVAFAPFLHYCTSVVKVHEELALRYSVSSGEHRLVGLG